MSPEEEQNLIVVRRTLATYGRVPVDLWLSDYARDFIYEEPGFSGHVRDRDGMRAALVELFAAHPEIALISRTLLASGDRIVVEAEAHYQHGARVQVYFQALVYTLRGQKVQGLRVYTQAGSQSGM